MKFPKAQFLDFCSKLVIDSKEQGLVPLKLNGAQRHFVDEICSGLDEGIHSFVCLKARQLGMTTICGALDLFWQFKYRGMQGAIATDDESNREMLRATMNIYMKNLPKEWKIGCETHNRNHLVLNNRSRVNYIVFGKRRRGDVGAGKGLNFLHGTEVASWGDPEGLASLTSSLAETHPTRLYVLESTARGFNLFYDIWNNAKNARSQKAIFVGWWLKEDYAIPKDSKIYKVYWDGTLDADEKKWVKQVKTFYGHTITPEQIAWWRWHLHEKKQSDLRLMYQDFPPTEDYAFVMTGDAFFPTDALQDLKRATEEPSHYRYLIGKEFTQTEIHEAVDGELSVWEEPDEEGRYVIGADPAYGSSEWSDQFVIQVCRCYADRLVQVAEYSTPQCTMYGFAWIIAHLAGAYRNSQVILEMNGPGAAVWQELQAMQARIQYLELPDHTSKRALLNLFGNVSHYLYKRPDSLGSGYSYHWQTTANTKYRIMHNLKDALARGVLFIKSEEWIDEARFVTQEGNRISGEGRAKDDKVIAMAFCVEAWITWVRSELESRGMTHARSHGDEHIPTVGERLVASYLSDIMSGRLQ